MRSEELNEISRLPDKYRPLSAWSYFGLGILFTVPLLGFIFLLIFSFSDKNINRRSFARSYFCALALVLIIVGLFLALGGLTMISDLLTARIAQLLG